MAVVAKALAGPAIALEMSEQGRQGGNDLRPGHQVFEGEIEAVAQDMAADKQHELVAAAADDADVALIRTGATVRAAGHAYAEFFVRKIEAAQLAFQFIDDAGQRSFGLGDSQTASRNRRTSHAMRLNLRKLIRPSDAVLGQNAVDLAFGAR